MKLSNRVLWILILLSMIWGFYIFYQVFFKIKLTELEINSNIENFSGSLENIKFSKEFYCEKKKCIIGEIPPFDYKLKIEKENYKYFIKNIDLNEEKDIKIFLEKKVIFEKVKEKKVSKLQQIKNSLKQKVEFWENKEKYNKIYNDKNLVYFKKNNKLFFYNLRNNWSFSISFIPKINNIKNLWNNFYVINTKIWSFNFYKLNKKIEYFSLFWDYIIYDSNYIWIINSDDKIRLRNFDLDIWNYVISYNTRTKEKYILKKLDSKIKKIYLEDKKIFIEDSTNNKFEIKNY